MKYNTRLLTLIFALILTVLTVIFSITASAMPKGANQPEYSTQKTYVLKDFQGRPAVFENENTDPLYILDIFTDQLPERDRERLKDGITAKTLEEIRSLAEDYE